MPPHRLSMVSPRVPSLRAPSAAGSLLLLALGACTGAPKEPREPERPLMTTPDAFAPGPVPDLAGPRPDLREVFSFAGLATAKASPSAVQLSWLTARDPGKPAGDIAYLIYEATSAGGQDLSTPTYTTAPGYTVYTVQRRQKSTTYYYIVRSRTPDGRIDENRVELSATTPDVADEQAPTFAGAAQVTAQSPLAVSLSWSAAVDDHAPAGELIYSIYQASAGGTYDFSRPSYVTNPGATTYFIGGLKPATSYRFVVRVTDLAGNRDDNSIEAVGATKEVSFASDISTGLFINHCIGACHSSRFPQEMLDLSKKDVSYASLVGVKSNRCGTVNLVDPGSADTSYLVMKLVGPTAGVCFSGARMPPGGLPINPTELLLLKAWINAGAPNN